jgi:hypothetical protein
MKGIKMNTQTPIKAAFARIFTQILEDNKSSLKEMAYKALKVMDTQVKCTVEIQEVNNATRLQSAKTEQALTELRATAELLEAEDVIIALVSNRAEIAKIKATEEKLEEEKAEKLEAEKREREIEEEVARRMGDTDYTKGSAISNGHGRAQRAQKN